MKTLLPMTVLTLVSIACATGGVDDTTPPPAVDADVIADLDITVTHPSHDPIIYNVSCLGDTFTITPEADGLDGATACTRLSEVATIDRLVGGTPGDRICTEIYGGEDLAVITGTIDGLAVDTTVDRTNGCGINDWDVLLAGVLPTPVGATS